MKKKNSLKHVDGQIVRRGKRLYVINKKNPRKKRRQG